MSVDDATDVMGIDDPEEMSPENINSMYRSKTKTDHPDQGGDQENFKKLKKAKNVLVDVAKASDGGGSNDSNFGVST
jgi:DnaJ-class molecular chaperone